MESETTLSSSVSSEYMLICTDSQCLKDEDEDCLSCEKCKRKVHYRCTKLPAYQIQTIIGIRSQKYYCQNCVKVSKQLLELVPNKPKPLPSIKLTNEIEKLKREVEGCESLIKHHVENENRLTETIEEKVGELNDLRQQLNTNPSFHTLEYVENKFEKKLEAMHQSILKTIDDNKRSYATVTKVNNQKNDTLTEDIKLAVKEARKEEVTKEEERKRRAMNIIIHGICEADESKDKEFVSNLINDLHTAVTVTKILRIGNKKDGKQRPIQISLENEEQKIHLMGNLAALKGIEEYNKISITEDLSPDERKQCRELSKEAHQRNTTQPSQYTWRVRGSSKNGFYLKKFLKKTNSTNHQ